MQAYLDGDAQAFSALFRRLAPNIQRFFQRSIDRATADDLTQQTFLKAHRARASYRAGARVKPWLFAIAGNVRIDYWRSRQRTPETDDETLQNEPTPGASQDGLLDAKRLEQLIHTHIAMLPERQRMVVHLHHFEGLKFSEIATVMGLTEGGAKALAFRAHEKLRTLLEVPQ